MADEVKIYENEKIQDNPFPEEIRGQGGIVGGGQGQIFGNTVIPDQSFPIPKVATQLISESLNTKSKKIIGEYQFTEMGAIKIGQVSISPDGILGEDLDGNTTFALDPDDGSATFKGTIIAGSIISGNVIVGANSVVIDGANKRIVINDGSNDRVLIGYQSGGF